MSARLAGWGTVVLVVFVLLAFFGIRSCRDIATPIAVNTDSGKASAEKFTLLIPQLRGDSQMRSTNRLFADLSEQGWVCLKFNRPLIQEDIIESSEEKRMAELDAAKSLLATHGGDLLIWGAITPIGSDARVSVFGQGDVAPAEIEINFGAEWASSVSSWLQAFLLLNLEDLAPKRPDESSSAYLRRAEPFLTKRQDLAENTQAQELRPLATELLAALESDLETARVDVQYRDGWRLVCPGGCTDRDLAKAEFCLLSASISATGQVPSRGYRFGVPLQELMENYEAAHAYWKSCLRAEGFSLERCQMNNPDCTIPLDPFSYIY